MLRLIIASAARTDLREIGSFSETRFGGRAARAYLKGLREQFEAVRQRPFIGRPEPKLGTTMRSSSYESHRIYYHIGGDHIRILRVLHHSRDQGAAFPPTP